jgi:hypothetical protein
MAKQKINAQQLKDQESWTAPTFQNSWTNYDASSWEEAGYMKDSLGFVHVRGFLKGGTTTPGTTVFTMPAGYRPLKNSYYPGGMNSSSAYTSWQVTPNGEVKVATGGSTTYSPIGHIIFKAEQ